MTTLEILYIVIMIFLGVIGTLLAMILLKINKILSVAEEVTGYYEKLKSLFQAYSKIPDSVKEKVKEKFSKK